MDDLTVVFPSAGSVGKKVAEVGQQLLPVTRDVFHAEVLEDELLTSEDDEENKK